MKVYLDDERETPEGWYRTYTVKATIETLKTGLVTELSLDNDLGAHDSREGHEVADWLADQVENHGMKPPNHIIIHTQDKAAQAMMRMAIWRIKQIHPDVHGYIRPGSPA